MLEITLFSILALFMLGGSLAMILNKQTIFSAFGFLVSMIGLAGVFALLDSRFLALAQIMVSVGAIVVLSILTILTINAKDENLPDEPNKFKWMLISTILIMPFSFLLYKTLLSLHQEFIKTQTITAHIIGNALFNKWVLSFEIVSILLLAAMLGAIVIVRKERRKEGHIS